RRVLVAAGRGAPDGGGELVEELPVDRLFDVDPLDTGARLAGVTEGTERGEIDCFVDVRVGRDDHRVLAAAFGDEGREALGARGHHLARGGARSGERHLVDTGTHEGRTGLAEAGDDLEDRLRGRNRIPLVLEPLTD